QTTQDILFRVRVNQIFQKLSSRHPTKVTAAAIASYYNSHKSQFGSAESRNLRIVLTKTQADAAKAKAALQSGQSFKDVAKKYSIDPSKTTGGVLNGVTVGQQDSGLTKAAFAAPLNKLIGPVKTQFGYYLIDVTKINPATQRSLAQSTALIKQTLQTQLQTQAQTLVDNHAKKDWLKKTSCRTSYAMADCSGYKAPKTTSTSGAAGASGATTAAP
ncbi:MAG: peptidylprolyl isomerase, partial [Solirubrobacteraceae bacterium]